MGEHTTTKKTQACRDTFLLRSFATVVRVTKAVPHARSGADKLNVFQYFLVDVILFMISVLLLIFATIFYVSRTLFRILRYIIRYPFSRTRDLSAKQMNKKKN
ncbi:hypothetical protein ANCDUO_08216 [Ancylostoma duodenale]|uniref:Uncharacterized protein n=1 Tax=Ancylostoma duodenale TaxID=51022 RepID=A0A0C2GQY0_9BILA|nr:hypothetical protein ANCDUO_08216 [Ancylostoma duodenale]